jgi:hypothetical protein
VQRLIAVSVVALGAITLLAVRDDAAAGVIAALAGGWVLMPSLLAASLRWPRLRYLLAVPSTLVGGGLVVFCLTGLPAGFLVRSGWWLVTAGIWLGSVLGMWFWYRWMPVPHGLDAPFGRGRWSLIALHAGSIVAGIGLLLL